MKRVPTKSSKSFIYFIGASARFVNIQGRILREQDECSRGRIIRRGWQVRVLGIPKVAVESTGEGVYIRRGTSESSSN